MHCNDNNFIRMILVSDGHFSSNNIGELRLGSSLIWVDAIATFFPSTSGSSLNQVATATI